MSRGNGALRPLLALLACILTWAVMATSAVAATFPCSIGPSDIAGLTFVNPAGNSSDANTFALGGVLTAANISATSGDCQDLPNGSIRPVAGNPASATPGFIVANATTQGGWLVRTASDEVRYLPPSSAFSGTDTFQIDNNNLGRVINVTVSVLSLVDTTPPAAPVIASPANGDVLGSSVLTISGTAEANAAVTVYHDGSSAATLSASSFGFWSFTSPLSEGAHSVYATATDASNNTSPNSTTVNFTVDTTPPPAPIVTAPTNGSTTSNTTPTISGSAEANATVDIVIDGASAGATSADGSGNWNFTPGSALADGMHSVRATATDAAGNTSVSSNTNSFTILSLPTVTDSSATVAHSSSNNAMSLALGGGAATSVTVVTSPAHGTATASGTSIHYTPAAGYAGPDSFTYRATNGAGDSAVATVTITVSPPTISLSPTTLTAPLLGSPYSAAITASGGSLPYSYSITGEVPEGLTLASNGTLSGTPTAPGTFNFTITGTDSSTGTGAPFSASRAYSFTVAAPTLTLSPAAGALPGATAGSAYSQTISLGGGVAPFGYAVTAGALPTGLTLNGSTGILSGTPTAAGTFNFTVTATDGLSFTVANAYSLTVATPTLAINGALPGGAIAVAYSQTLTASGGVAPYSFTLYSGSLPAGLSLSPGGVLSGTPTQSGSFNLTIRATDSSGGSGPAFVDRSFTLVIGAPTISPEPTTLPAMSYGVPISASVTASGGTAPYSYRVSAGALPAGLTLAGDGTLSGTPTVAGNFSFTVEATDSSTGTGAPFSGSRTYSVTVGAPRVTFVIESSGDGAFAFTSVEPSLNFVVNATGGGGTSGQLAVPPGSHSISFTAPAGSEIASAACNSPGSSLDSASRSGTVVVQAGDEIVCTIVAGDIRPTTELIGAFLEARANLIVANQPDSARRLERLTGSYSNSAGVAGFGLTVPGQLPIAMRFTGDQASFAYSLGRAQAEPAAGSANTAADDTSGGVPPIPYADQATSGSDNRPPFGAPGVDAVDEVAAEPLATPFDLWIEGKLARFNAPGGDGRFGIVHGGADYLVGPGVLVGLGVQLDWTEMEGNGDATIEGTGYLAGPYLTARLTDGLFLDARAAWGQSSNTASPLGTYSDQLDGTRWLVSAALIGQYDIDRWRIAPTARLTYFEEKTDAYTDGLGLPIPEVEIATGTFEFGPRISYQTELDNGTAFQPFVSLEGVWTFEQKNTGTSATSSPGLADTGLRGRSEVGFSLSGGAGSVSASAFYDGLGDNDFESWGGKLRFNKTF